MLIRSAGRAPMIKMIQLFGSVCLLFHSTILASDEDCKWSKHVGAPETYYINLDRSKDRRANMERHLDNVGMSHFRVRGISPKEIYIPEDIENTWRTAQCKMKTDWVPPAKRRILLKN
jgi:hypothetical protein